MRVKLAIITSALLAATLVITFTFQSSEALVVGGNCSKKSGACALNNDTCSSKPGTCAATHEQGSIFPPPQAGTGFENHFAYTGNGHGDSPDQPRANINQPPPSKDALVSFGSSTCGGNPGIGSNEKHGLICSGR